MAGPMFTGTMSLLLLFLLPYSTVSQFCNCWTGVCIAQSQVCDGYPNCYDGRATDELNCADMTECPLHFERCPGTSAGTNNICIHPQWRCDGDNDCDDFSDEDEAFCRDTPCPSTMVKCQDSGRCLPGFTYCNGENECQDGSDEPVECDDPSFTCPTDHFKCTHGRRCIPNVWLCDMEDDCGDGSDEDEALHSCSTYTCPPEYFTCERNRPGRSRCIPHDSVCDGYSHCEYGEDEDTTMCGVREPCSLFEYECDNHLCIPAQWRCDHDNDCGDGSDEGSWCNYQPCTNGFFTCNNGRCIHGSLECDGYNDCRDNSDEDKCSCNEGEFQCENKNCIPESSLCNTINDCGDNSDELASCNVNECISAEHPACEYRCVDDPLSYHCECQDGFALNDDGLTCSDFNECIQTPYVCPQKCINKEGYFICSCQEGFDEQPDGSCRRSMGGEPFLVFANRYYIRRMGVELNSPDYSIIAQGFDAVVALDFDYWAQKLYLSDVGNQTIFRMNMDGTNVERIHTYGVAGVEGLAVDWVSEKLYWTDRITDAVEVSDLDGKNRKALLRTGLFEPRDIALDPKHGYLYWVDWGLNAYIGRMGMDGSNETELHNDWIGWPNGLTIDYGSEVVYWVDAHLDYIAYTDLNFIQVHRLLHDEIEHTIAHPFGITVFNDYIYYSDWNLKKIYRAHKYGGNEIELKTLIHRPFGIHLVHELRQPQVANPCAGISCAGMCLISPNGPVCACAENYRLTAGGGCSADCPQGMVACGISEDKCIPWYRMCDGVEDCAGGFDESISCSSRSCPPGKYQCRNGECLDSYLFLCNEDLDCLDGSDEGQYARCDSTSCHDWEFKCEDSGACISERKVCDKRYDCQDGSDEDAYMCSTHTCSEGYFQCSDGYCIPQEWKCDLDDDCGDNSDEPHRECQISQCASGWVACANNYRCIPEYAVCNTQNDCRDNSDELYCEARTCDPLGEFRCNNHRCIPQRWYCDFDNDCGDFSDEETGCVPRECSESEFRCVSRGRCIRGHWVCDGNADCSDGSDEDPMLCSETCEGQFRCVIGGCIESNRTCNGVNDCSDGSDEENCPDVKCEEFQCSNSICIENKRVCDIFDDCGDNSDETLEACNNKDCTSVTCLVKGHLSCLPDYKQCDGTQDCDNNADELNCVVDCSESTFRCVVSRECIPWNKLCNDVPDCIDGTDEAACFEQMGDCESTCDKECIVLGTGAVCTCRDGYEESAQGCQDIDECSLGIPCPQVCINTMGSFYCSCAPGFLDRDVDSQGLDCKGNGDREVILFGTHSEIRKFDPLMDRYEDILENELRVEGMDSDFSAGKVYFTDSLQRAVKRVSFNNDEEKHAPDHLGLDNVYKPIGIAFDWLGNNIYLTDQGIPENTAGRRKRAVADFGAKIVVVALRSPPYPEKTLHQPVTPYAIAVNPRLGLMYWTDHGDNLDSHLFMSWMNGENKTAVMSAAGRLDAPTGLAVDYTNEDRVYFCDPRQDKIGYISSNGHLFRFIQVSEGLSNPYSIDVFGNSIYWTTQNRSEIGKIRFLNKVSEEMHDLLSGVHAPTGIKIWHRQRYPLGEVNPCGRNPCSHLCLIVPKKKGDSQLKNYDCACPSGVNIDTSLCEDTTVSPCDCLNGGTCLANGKCLCPDNYDGEKCAANISSSSKQTVVLASGLGGFILLAIIIIAILLIVFLKKRKKEFAGQVRYRDGQNVDIHPPPAGRTVEPSTIYESTLNPQAPVTFENPSYPNVAVGAVGGGAVAPDSKEKVGLPYNPANYQPGYDAEALPPKGGMEPVYDEPPPAYTPSLPPKSQEPPQ